MKNLLFIFLFLCIGLSAQPGPGPMDGIRFDTSIYGIWKSSDSYFEEDVFLIDTNTVTILTSSELNRKNGKAKKYFYLRQGNCFFYYVPEKKEFCYLGTWSMWFFTKFLSDGYNILYSKVRGLNLNEQERKILNADYDTVSFQKFKQGPVYGYQYCSVSDTSFWRSDEFRPVFKEKSNWIHPSRRPHDEETEKKYKAGIIERGFTLSIEASDNEFYWMKADSGAAVKTGFYAGVTTYSPGAHGYRPRLRLMNATSSKVAFALPKKECYCSLIILTEKKDTIVYKYRLATAEYFKKGRCEIPPGGSLWLDIVRPYEKCGIPFSYKYISDFFLDLEADTRKKVKQKEVKGRMKAIFSIDRISKKVDDWSGIMFSQSVDILFEP